MKDMERVRAFDSVVQLHYENLEAARRKHPVKNGRFMVDSRPVREGKENHLHEGLLIAEIVNKEVAGDISRLQDLSKKLTVEGGTVSEFVYVGDRKEFSAYLREHKGDGAHILAGHYIATVHPAFVNNPPGIPSNFQISDYVPKDFVRYGNAEPINASDIKIIGARAYEGIILPVAVHNSMGIEMTTILLRATGYGDTGMGPIWEQTYRGTKRNFSFNTNPDNRAGYPAEYPEIVGVHRSYKRMPNEELRCVFSTDGNHYRPQVPLDNYESCLVPVPGLVPTLNGHGPNGRNGHNGTGKKHYVPELPILA